MYYWDIEQVFDSDFYIEQALYHANLGMPYPSAYNIFDVYIQSPGYINMLVLLIVITGSYKMMHILGILMNVCILVDIYYISSKLFGKRVAYYATFFYCIIPTNIFVPIWLVTELPYLFLGLTAFSLSLQQRTKFLIASGVMYALAQTIRPIAISFLLCSLLFFLLHHFNFRKYLCLLVPFFLILFISGMYVKSTTGYFVTSSTVGGYDLMYTSYDQADGGQNPWFVFGKDGPGYIENMDKLSFAEKDSIWTSRSITWIKKNPTRYISLCFRRLFLMYKSDLWTIPKLSINDTVLLRVVKIIVNLPYFIVLFLALSPFFTRRKDWSLDKLLIPLHVIIGTGATCLFGMEVRYHYPFVFALAIMAANNFIPLMHLLKNNKQMSNI
jgi:hypothetical protein